MKSLVSSDSLCLSRSSKNICQWIGSALWLSYSLLFCCHRLQSDSLLCPWDFPGKRTLEWLPLPGDLPTPGLKPRSPALAGLPILLPPHRLGSRGTQSCIDMYPFSPKLPSHPGWHRTLIRVPCAIQQVLVGIYTALCSCPFPIPYYPFSQSVPYSLQP